MKVLMIGNSFSACVGKNLPAIVRSGGRHRLELTSAYIGGCSLQTHAEHLAAAEKDRAFAPYRISCRDSGDLRKHGSRPGNVLNVLKENNFDVVTIQQTSPASWDYKTYFPWAETVIRYVKKFNPGAKIMIQQTWSYRADSPRLADWNFDSEEMFRRVVKAYDAFAADTGFELIPAGRAVDICRKNCGMTYKVLSEKQRAAYRFPDLPPAAADVVGRDFWKKDEDGVMRLTRDTTHLNFRGEYLQACVWYGSLFDEDPREIAFEPADMGSDLCRFLRNCAFEALENKGKEL